MIRIIRGVFDYQVLDCRGPKQVVKAIDTAVDVFQDTYWREVEVRDTHETRPCVQAYYRKAMETWHYREYD